MQIRYSVVRASQAQPQAGEWAATEHAMADLGRQVFGYLADPDVLKLTLESEASGR